MNNPITAFIWMVRYIFEYEEIPIFERITMQFGWFWTILILLLFILLVSVVIGVMIS